MSSHDDAINPKHYQGVYVSVLDVGAFEVQCIDVIEVLDLGFHLGNALKYAWRFGRKHDRVDEEIAKCLWYLDRWRAHGYESKDLRAVAAHRIALAGHLRNMCEAWSKRPGASADWDSAKWMVELIELLGIENQLAAHVRKQNAG